jgi:hypothetical protein
LPLCYHRRPDRLHKLFSTLTAAPTHSRLQRHYAPCLCYHLSPSPRSAPQAFLDTNCCSHSRLRRHRAPWPLLPPPSPRSAPQAFLDTHYPPLLPLAAPTTLCSLPLCYHHCRPDWLHKLFSALTAAPTRGSNDNVLLAFVTTVAQIGYTSFSRHPPLLPLAASTTLCSLPLLPLSPHFGKKYRKTWVKRPSREPGRARTADREPGRARESPERPEPRARRARESPGEPGRARSYIYFYKQTVIEITAFHKAGRCARKAVPLIKALQWPSCNVRSTPAGVAVAVAVGAGVGAAVAASGGAAVGFGGVRRWCRSGGSSRSRRRSRRMSRRRSICGCSGGSIGRLAGAAVGFAVGSRIGRGSSGGAVAFVVDTLR